LAQKLRNYIVFLRDKGIIIYNCSPSFISRFISSEYNMNNSTQNYPILNAQNNNIIILAVDKHVQNQKIEKLIEEYKNISR
jgi:hypothetical protein